MSSLQEECIRLREAAQNGDIDTIKTLSSSGVDVINADVSDYQVSKYYMLYWVILLVLLCINWCEDDVMVDKIMTEQYSSLMIQSNNIKIYTILSREYSG